MALELKTDDDCSTVTDAELVPDGDPDTTYTIRHITSAANRVIVKRNTKRVPNPRTHQRDDEVNWNAVQDDLIDELLQAWSGVVAKGEPLACVRANKLLLDGVRKTALLEHAGMNEVAQSPERRAASFRPPENVR